MTRFCLGHLHCLGHSSALLDSSLPVLERASEEQPLSTLSSRSDRAFSLSSHGCLGHESEHTSFFYLHSTSS